MKRKRKNNIKISLLSILVTLVFVFVIYEIARINTLKTVRDDGLIYTQEQVDELVMEAEEKGRESVLLSIKGALLSGKSVISVLKGFYPDQLVVASSGAYHFLDISDTLARNDYNIDFLEEDEETGFYTYEENGQVKSKMGIDVSSHQGKINWSEVKSSGIEFAFVRGVYRGYGSGKIVIDDNCLKNVDGAKSAGLDVGVYVFSQAINEKEAIEEANEVLKLLNGRSLELPIVFDVEKISKSDVRMNALSVDERTDVTIAFLETIKSAGYDAMIYHNTEMGSLLIDLERLEDYPKWFAGYNMEFYWPYKYDIWQYTESGSVPGIKGNVDLDLMFIQ